MCGLVNEKMSPMNVLQDLSHVCIETRQRLKTLTEQKDRETLIVNHIKRFDTTEAQIGDFPRGNYLDVIIYKECILLLFLVGFLSNK